MMISIARTSPCISRCHWATMSRNTTCLSSSRLPNSCTGFSSVAPPSMQFPIHSYNSPLTSLSSLRESSVTSSTMDLPFYDIDVGVWGNNLATKKENGRIRNIKDFVDRMPEAVHSRKIENIEPGSSNDPVAKLFRRTDLHPDAWQKYALFDNNKPYTRNLISTDHETYTLLLLCWNPEQESPIHDHPCDGCWLQVLDGGVREVRYDRQLNRVSQIEYRRGELSYITDNVGYHKVGNPTQTPAVTLHLYAPPFETCKCWHSDEANPSEPSEGKSVNHSEYGILKET